MLTWTDGGDGEVVGRIIGYALLGAVIAIPIPLIGPIFGAIVGGVIGYFHSKRRFTTVNHVSMSDYDDLDRKRLALRLGIERIGGRFYLGQDSYETLEDAIAAGERNRSAGARN